MATIILSILSILYILSRFSISQMIQANYYSHNVGEIIKII